MILRNKILKVFPHPAQTLIRSSENPGDSLRIESSKELGSAAAKSKASTRLTDSLCLLLRQELGKQCIC